MDRDKNLKQYKYISDGGEIEKFTSPNIGMKIYGYSSDDFIFVPTKNTAKISKTLRARVFKRDNYTCKFCGHNIKKNLTLDHILPRTLGGKNTMQNLQVLCNKCNNEKGCKVIKHKKKKIKKQL